MSFKSTTLNLAIAGAAGVAAGALLTSLFKGRKSCHRKQRDIEEPVQKFVRCLSPEGFHKLAYVEWGHPRNPNIIVCCHGLTRNSRDFDFLAKRLSSRYRVISVDVVGRGKSDWLATKTGYGYPQYLNDMTTLLSAVCAKGQSVTWIGTSMGGLIGIMLAAQQNSPIKQLVVNDIGPFVSKEAINRIASYVGKGPNFDTLKEAEAYFRKNYEPHFGGLYTQTHWEHLSLHGVQIDGPKEEFKLAYDPGIAVPFAAAAALNKDVDLWPIWAKITCPVLVLHGEISDVLSADTAAKMKSSGESKDGGPKDVTVHTYKGVGHMPPLVGQDNEDVDKWITARDTKYVPLSKCTGGAGSACGKR